MLMLVLSGVYPVDTEPPALRRIRRPTGAEV